MKINYDSLYIKWGTDGLLCTVCDDNILFRTTENGRRL